MSSKTTCKESGCIKPSLTRGWCKAHYHRARRAGLVETRKYGALAHVPCSGTLCTRRAVCRVGESRTPVCHTHWARWKSGREDWLGQARVLRRRKGRGRLVRSVVVDDAVLDTLRKAAEARGVLPGHVAAEVLEAWHQALRKDGTVREERLIDATAWVRRADVLEAA